MLTTNSFLEELFLWKNMSYLVAYLYILETDIKTKVHHFLRVHHPVHPKVPPLTLLI